MKPIIFYNDKCSICNYEINHYKKNCHNIDWNGIHDTKDLLNIIDKTPKQLVRRLHLIKDNKIYEGVDAFAYIWPQIPNYRILSKIIKLPIIYILSKFFYEIIAYLLYLKNIRHVNKINETIKDNLHKNKENL